MNDRRNRDIEKNIRDNQTGEDDNVIYVDTNAEAAKRNSEMKRRLEAKKRTGLLLILLCVVIVVAVVISYRNRTFRGYKVLESVDTNYENTADYVQFASNLLKYTPDGVSYINENGDTVWTAGVNMKIPVAAVCGNYAVVADVGGNTVCVFDIAGQVSSVTMPYNICDVDVANQGAFAVVLESDKTNYINLYKKNGDIICEMQTTIDKSGYPLDISLSDNGEKLFTSYLNVKGTAVSDSLAAYNFGDVGQNSNADRMVGGYIFENEIFPKVEFVDNNTVVAYGTKNIYVYSMKEKPSEIAKIGLEQEARSIFYNEGYIGYICENKENVEHPYMLMVYDTHGRKKFSENIDFTYDKIYAARKEIIVTGGDSCKIIRLNGSVKFDGTLKNRIISMVPYGKDLEYVVVYANSTDIIKLKTEPGTSVENGNNDGDDTISDVTAVDTQYKTEEPASEDTQSEDTQSEDTPPQEIPSEDTSTVTEDNDTE